VNAPTNYAYKSYKTHHQSVNAEPQLAFSTKNPSNRNEDGNQKRRTDDPNTKNKEVNNRTKEGA